MDEKIEAILTSYRGWEHRYYILPIEGGRFKSMRCVVFLNSTPYKSYYVETTTIPMFPSHIGHCHGMTGADWLVPVLYMCMQQLHMKKRKLLTVYNIRRLALKIEQNFTAVCQLTTLCTGLPLSWHGTEQELLPRVTALSCLIDYFYLYVINCAAFGPCINVYKLEWPHLSQHCVSVGASPNRGSWARGSHLHVASWSVYNWDQNGIKWLFL